MQITEALAREYAALKKDTDAKLARMKEIGKAFLAEHEATGAVRIDFGGLMKSVWYDRTSRRLDAGLVEKKFGVKLTPDCYVESTTKCHSMIVDKKADAGLPRPAWLF